MKSTFSRVRQYLQRGKVCKGYTIVCKRYITILVSKRKDISLLRNRLQEFI